MKLLLPHSLSQKKQSPFPDFFKN